MTGARPEGDGGLQAERTVLAWTRTALATAVSGGAALIRDRDIAEVSHHPARLVIAATATMTTVGVLLLGIRRRRVLIAGGRRAARREVLTLGVTVLTLAILVMAYLALPLP